MENRHLARRQADRRLPILAQRLGHRRRNINVARNRRIARGDDLIGRVALADHPARAEFQRVIDFAIVAFAGQDNHRHVARPDDFGEDIHPAHVGQVEVEDDDIDRLGLNEGADRRAAVEPPHHHEPLVPREEQPQPALRDRMVVHDQDPVMHGPPSRIDAPASDAPLRRRPATRIYLGSARGP